MNTWTLTHQPASTGQAGSGRQHAVRTDRAAGCKRLLGGLGSFPKIGGGGGGGTLFWGPYNKDPTI